MFQVIILLYQIYKDDSVRVKSLFFIISFILLLKNFIIENMMFWHQLWKQYAGFLQGRSNIDKNLS